MNLSTRDRRAIIVGVIILSAILVVEYGLVPWIDSWGDARARIGVPWAQQHRAGDDHEEQRAKGEQTFHGVAMYRVSMNSGAPVP